MVCEHECRFLDVNSAVCDNSNTRRPKYLRNCTINLCRRSEIFHFLHSHLRKRVATSLHRYPCRPSVAKSNLNRLATTKKMIHLLRFLIICFRYHFQDNAINYYYMPSSWISINIHFDFSKNRSTLFKAWEIIPTSDSLSLISSAN